MIVIVTNYDILIDKILLNISNNNNTIINTKYYNKKLIIINKTISNKQ